MGEQDARLIKRSNQHPHYSEKELYARYCAELFRLIEQARQPGRESVELACARVMTAQKMRKLTEE